MGKSVYSMEIERLEGKGGWGVAQPRIRVACLLGFGEGRRTNEQLTWKIEGRRGRGERDTTIKTGTVGRGGRGGTYFPSLLTPRCYYHDRFPELTTRKNTLLLPTHPKESFSLHHFQAGRKTAHLLGGGSQGEGERGLTLHSVTPAI